MAEREKVVSVFNGLRQFADMDIHPIVSPDNWLVYSKLRDAIDVAEEDIITLLKEQEAVTEYVMDEYQPTCKACGFRPFVGYIPSLEWMRERGFKFCSHCGQAINWEEEKTDGNHEND